MKRAWFMFLVGLVIMGLATLSFVSIVAKKVYDFGPLQERKQVVIEQGMTLRQVGQKLEDEGIIYNKGFFVFATRLFYRQPVRAGEYSFPRQASLKTVIHILISGEKYMRRLTVPEGLTSYQVVQLIDSAEGLTGHIVKIPPNGSLLPETYYYSYGDSKSLIVSRMQRAMEDTLLQLWENRDSSLPLASPQEALVLASLIEKETSVPEERAHIASVFYNRLAKGIKLQSDPTVIYALSKGKGVLDRKLTSKDLKTQHPCNTYVVKGLPPEPIANPGRDALEAALHPQDTDDLFFVANGTGGHTFAVDYKDHVTNTRQWKLYRKSVQPPIKPDHLKDTEEPAP
ncbi:MAG: endolytic transglycosylase MltG [Alphaproteobacteria bacterium]|nr:endolytic transglycosylase MltG [Alphaproteobacteria bacterium]